MGIPSCLRSNYNAHNALPASSQICMLCECARFSVLLCIQFVLPQRRRAHIYIACDLCVCALCIKSSGVRRTLRIIVPIEVKRTPEDLRTAVVGFCALTAATCSIIRFVRIATSRSIAVPTCVARRRNGSFAAFIRPVSIMNE